MMAVEDCIDALNWVESIGGVKATIKRSQANLSALEEWVNRTSWAEFLAEQASSRSTTSVCISIVDEDFVALGEDDQQAFIATFCKLLASEKVAYDIKSYKAAPAGLRIWCGATIEADDVKALTAWLDWAFAATKEEALAKAA